MCRLELRYDRRYGFLPQDEQLHNAVELRICSPRPLSHAPRDALAIRKTSHA